MDRQSVIAMLKQMNHAPNEPLGGCETYTCHHDGKTRWVFWGDRVTVALATAMPLCDVFDLGILNRELVHDTIVLEYANTDDDPVRFRLDTRYELSRLALLPANPSPSVTQESDSTGAGAPYILGNAVFEASPSDSNRQVHLETLID